MNIIQYSLILIAESKDGIYGESILKRILFPAKMYLAVLTSTLMLKLIKSPDKRIWYVQTGLDNQLELTVQNFVRSIKTKEINMGNLASIDTIMNTIGSFHDYYMPVVNGEKPVELDTIQGQDTNQSNEFLEYLLKSILTGLGVPPEVIGYENAEFARSLSMQNGKFVRSIVSYQLIFGITMTNLIRKLISKTYKIEEIDWNVIDIKFPKPSFLNMEHEMQSINNKIEMVDRIYALILSDSIQNEAEKAIIKREISKQIIVDIDFPLYEKIIENARRAFVKENLGKLKDQDSI